MATLTHNPSADWRNNGWTIAGGAGSLWATLVSGSPTSTYLQCPASGNEAAVSFPLDITGIPDGAVVTSVTIKSTVSLGAGSAPAGQSAALTVDVPCQDDTSRFRTRTIPVTNSSASPADITIATYDRDALGFLWDVHRLNKLLCRVRCLIGVFDLIRCYRLWCVINYHVRPTITVEQPSGTVYTPSPTISWTYSQVDGDPQVRSEYRLFTAVQQADVSFNPETAPPVFAAAVQGDVSQVILPTSINPDSYWVYVRSYSSRGARSVWVGRQFTVSGPAPGTPGTDDPTGTATPGTGVIEVVPDSVTGSATLTLRDTSNMLSVQAADAETTSDGHQFTLTNCTVARDSASAFPGGQASWKLTAASAADMAITSGWVEVAGSTPVTARAQFKAAVTGRSCRVRVLFYDAAFTVVAGTLTGSTITDATSTWTEAVVTGPAPAGAVYAQLAVDVLAPANAEVHSIDRLGLMYGTSTPWSDGGHMSRNLLSSWYSTAEPPAGAGEAWTAGVATTVGTASPPGTGGSGATCTTLTYVGLTPTLAFRAAGTAFTSPTSGTNYTLNKPAGVVSGDLMVAFVSANEAGTITPPAGWTAVNTASVDDGSTDTALWVLKRTAGGAEPASWTDGTVATAATRRHAVVVAYSGAADAAQQFIAEAQTSTPNNLPLYLTSPTVNNTDPNAWRISAFAVNDDAASGALVANVQQPATVPAITYVGRATAWKDTGASSSYTINRPTGVASGDLMIATVGVSGSVTVTAPSGWTVVRQAVASGSKYTHAVLKRTAGGSEPASWSGSVSGTVGHTKVTQAVAYRNAADASQQFLAENIATAGGASSINTASVTNTNSLAWRVTAFGAAASYADSWSETETIERCDDTAAYADNGFFGFGAVHDSTTVAIADSNGSVSTGAYQRTGTLSESWYGAGAWIGIIKPLSSPPSSVPNETQRAQTSVGSSNPWLTTLVADSAGVIPAGNTSVTGIFTPGSGSDLSSAAAWVGIIRPATPVRNGYALATMATTVDVSSVDDSVPDLGGQQVTATAAFTGTAAGTPYLTVNFYRANQLLNSLVAPGTPFGTSTWVKSAATFPVPAGTTRMSVGVSVSDRNVSDVVYFDRVGLAFGDSPVWRSGTSRPTHPVWAGPEIEYADDDGTGYGDWRPLPGVQANPPSYDELSGLVTYTDHTIVPLTNRKYRARTVSYGLAGDQFVSGWGPDSGEVSFVAENWWLKDIRDPDSNLLLRRVNVAGGIAVGTTNTAAVFQPLGEDYPIVLTEGYKSDQFTLTVDVLHLDWVFLRLLLRSGRTLFLQSDTDQAWWVRPVGDLPQEMLPTGQRQSNPMRRVKLAFVEVATET